MNLLQNKVVRLKMMRDSNVSQHRCERGFRDGNRPRCVFDATKMTACSHRRICHDLRRPEFRIENLPAR